VKAHRISTTIADLGEIDAQLWASAPVTVVGLFQSPVILAREVSPQIALRTDHGALGSLNVQTIHNGTHLAIRTSWQMPEPHTIDDLDRFADAVAVMFPMHREANAMTMGASGQPVNAWYWRAGDSEPFDVVAEGLGTTLRRDPKLTALRAGARYTEGSWAVTFVRPLVVEAEAARFTPGVRTGIAFSVWDGGRSERAAYKSSSLVFGDFELEA